MTGDRKCQDLANNASDTLIPCHDSDNTSLRGSQFILASFWNLYQPLEVQVGRTMFAPALPPLTSIFCGFTPNNSALDVDCAVV